MPDIKFEDDYQRSTASYGLPQKGMAGWMVDKGIVPNKKSAEVILLIITVLCFALTFYVIKSNFIRPTFKASNTVDSGFEFDDTVIYDEAQ